jgi:hypothetical protein
MQVSIFLARLLGPLLLVPGVSLLLNPKAFRAIATDLVRSLPLIYLLGFLDMAAGLAIVLVHNVWVADWRVLITILGWLLLVRGVVRQVAADRIVGYAAKLFRNKLTYPISGGVMVVLGLTLCYFGYRV